MPSHDTEVAHLAARKTTGARIYLLRIASRDNAIVHHDQHTLVARAVGGSNANCGKQVDRAIRADARRRTLSAHHDDRLRRSYGVMEEGGVLVAVRCSRR